MDIKILHPLPDKLPQSNRKPLTRKELLALIEKIRPGMEKQLKYVEEHKKTHTSTGI